VTGDQEVDAVLWLRSIINTGQAALIERAMEAAKKIKAPLDVLEMRYRNHLTASNPGNLFAALSSFGFADLESLSVRAIEQHRHDWRACPALVTPFWPTPRPRCFASRRCAGWRSPRGRCFSTRRKQPRDSTPALS
jgi:hypothetical protein